MFKSDSFDIYLKKFGIQEKKLKFAPFCRFVSCWCIFSLQLYLMEWCCGGYFTMIFETFLGLQFPQIYRFEYMLNLFLWQIVVYR